MGARQAAKGGAGANRDHRRRPFHRLLENVQVAVAGDGGIAHVGAGSRQGTIHYHQVGTPVLLHGLETGLLGGIAGSGLKGVVIVQGDDVENQVLDRGGMAAGQGLGAARAFLEG